MPQGGSCGAEKIEFGLASGRKPRRFQKAVDEVQRVAHMALVRVQTRNDSFYILENANSAYTDSLLAK